MTLVLPRRAEQLVERLRGYIREHKLEAGMRLPAERQLAVELGVSRNSLREALQMLISEGLLLSRRGGGTFIRYQLEPWSEQRIVQPIRHLMADDPDYRYDILEARYAIEASTAWHAAMRATPADKERLQYCFDATLQFKESDDPNLAAQADLRFHLAVAEASHNVVLLQTMRGFFRFTAILSDAKPPAHVHPPADFRPVNRAASEDAGCHSDGRRGGCTQSRHSPFRFCAYHY